MKRLIGSSIAALVLVAAVGAQAKEKHQAKNPMDTARAAALSKVTGKIVKEELEKDKGRWIYTFDIKPTGETGRIIKEVNLDADTGEVISIDTERN
jgi:uncharacterized membrane protein YkoI